MDYIGWILIQTLVNLAWLPLRLVMIILGLVMVPLGQMTVSRSRLLEKAFSPWYDGYTPDWWLRRFSAPRPLAEFWYHAIRNPANGMKWWFDDVPPEDTIVLGDGHNISPKLAREQGKRLMWHYRHDGRFLGSLFLNLIWSDTHHLRFRFGFKVGSMVEGMGYTISFIPWRKG